MYNFPFTIVQDYYKLLLGIGGEMNNNKKIMSSTHMFKHHEDHPETIATLFSSRMNKPKLYPPFVADSFNQNISYSQIDLFYLILSNIVTISAVGPKPETLDFRQLHSYLSPSYDSMMNSTKF